MRDYLTRFILFGLLVLASEVAAQQTVSGLDGVEIGQTTPAKGTFTDLKANDSFTLGTDKITNFDNIDDKKVKASSNSDSTAGFLIDELKAGTNVTITEFDDAGNKKVEISASGGGGTGGPDSADGTEILLATRCWFCKAP